MKILPRKKHLPPRLTQRRWYWPMLIGLSLVLLIILDAGIQFWYYHQSIARVNNRAIPQERWDSAVQLQCGPIIVNQLIDQQLVEQVLANAHITISNEQINQQIQAEQTAYGKSNEEFWHDLAKQGIDEATYRYRTQLNLAVRELLRPTVPEPSANEVATYIVEHKDDPAFQELGLTQEALAKRGRDRLIDINLSNLQANYPQTLRQQSTIENYYQAKPAYRLFGSIRLLFGL